MRQGYKCFDCAEKDAQIAEKENEIKMQTARADCLYRVNAEQKAEIEDLKAQIMGGCRECESKIQPELARLRRVEELAKHYIKVLEEDMEILDIPKGAGGEVELSYDALRGALEGKECHKRP